MDRKMNQSELLQSWMDLGIGRKKEEYRRNVLSLIFRLSALLMAAVIIFHTVFGIVTISGNDMYPAIRDGDVAILFRTGDYIRSDAVVYHASDGLRCGRVQGRGGDTIDLTADGQITIGGRFQPVCRSQGIYELTRVRQGGIRYPKVVPAGSYFLLGDNRSDARDSRSYGCVDGAQIKGKVFLVIRRRMV